MSFVRDLKEYKRDFNITDNYTRQLAIGLARLRGVDEAVALEFMHKVLEENKERIDGTKIEFTLRGENGDRTVREVPILDYLKKINDGRLGMSPTLTSYKRPDQELSLIVEDIAQGMAKRKIVKKEAHAAKQAGNTVLNTIKNGGQNAIKVLINSWSGASLDKHNTFNCQSTHPTLTTMCRVSTALATASVERFLGGKRYYHTPEKVIEDILVTIDKCCSATISVTMDKFKLKYPSIDDVLTVIKRSTEYYWWDSSGYKTIIDLVKTLSPQERAAVVYDGDFYHMYTYNKDFIDTMLTKLSTTLSLEDPNKDRLKEMDGDIATLVSNLMGNEIKGTALWDYLDPEKHPADNPIKVKANLVANNLLNGFDEYKLLITTFFRTNHFPIDVGAQNHAIRVTVPLGDTDSTIFSTKHINAMYYGECTFEEDQEPVSDVMVYMVNGIIAHALGNFTAQLGVVEDRRDLLVMKNEYKFPSLQLLPVAKTYHAYVKAQEGLVFSKREFELKGSRFHAGASNQDLVKELHQLMDDNLVNLNQGKKINRGELVDIILRVEEDIVGSLSRKDNVYFKRGRIRNHTEYKKPDISVYNHYTLWNEVFGEKYGKAPDPTYMAYKVDLNYPNGFEEFFNTLTPKQQKGIDMWRVKHQKKDSVYPTAFLVPMENFFKYGLPEELKPFAYIQKIANSVLDPHRLNLQAMGILLDKGKKSDSPGIMLSEIIEEE